MREAGFDGRTVLYVASALLSYKGGPEELQQVSHNTLPVLRPAVFSTRHEPAVLPGLTANRDA